jgi:hypothetical protein
MSELFHLLMNQQNSPIITRFQKAKIYETSYFVEDKTMRQIPGSDEPYVWSSRYRFYLFPVSDEPLPKPEITAVSVVAIPWVKPFLTEMGLPEPIVQQPQLLQPIYEKMIATQKFIEDSECKALAPGNPIEYHVRIVPESALKALIGALQEISEQLGRTVAIDFEHWLRRHFLCDEIRTAMRHWGYVLGDACFTPDPDNPRLIPPPAFMDRFFSRIEPLISYWHIDLLQERLQQAVPQRSAEELAMSDGEIIQSRGDNLVEEVIRQESTMEALKILAKELNEPEKQEFIIWAQKQADVISVADSKGLYEDTYLRVERPFANSPSLLDLSPATKLIDKNFYNH